LNADFVPGYIESRIRQRAPEGVRVVKGSTPVISFGDVRRARVATLGWNPSKLEFLDANDRELAEEARRLETLSSLNCQDLATAPSEAIDRIFQGCNTYFCRRPYRRWFGRLEKVLQCVDASYYNSSACHLDLVQWATDPVWSGLERSEREKLLKADLPTLLRQLELENISLVLLNGIGIVQAYRKHVALALHEASSCGGRVEMYAGHLRRGRRVVGWNINLQSTPGVTNEEIAKIGAKVKVIVGTSPG
jgi:hypothetical protein